MADLEARHGAEQEALAKRQADLDRERRTLKATQQAETAKARAARDKARATFERDMKQWRG